MRLIELLINSDKNFDAIYSRFNKKIEFLTMSFQLELYKNDIVLFLWQLTKKINISNFKSEEELYKYISVSLKNYCINIYYKQAKNKNVTYNSMLTNIEIDKKYSCNPMDNSSLAFDELISSLSDKQKKVITMRYKYCLSDCEIANFLSISRQAVYKSRKSALSILEKTYRNALS
ncbi:sigma factor-like helix-turn-helix DNA-binding protein [Clostridium sp. HBUAS56017]|uniref:sigma factor-like helix-turn-helix DNA-binding protein n=1 Tax=Clostridium sp. HBUAS56017 TaxID=2571128 RepID=UPI001178C3C0|nr:sigma factor-like helix-turn-helix DNA-binding protein [Clostridium sp. HBUAS56017]